jgi:hypothetical protein
MAFEEQFQSGSDPILQIENKKLNKINKCTKCTSELFSNWGTIKHGVPQWPILGPLLFIMISTLPGLIIFTNDTRVIISGNNFDDFCTTSNTVE